jgi:hypothetical protein
MAYIGAQDVKAIRDELKATFPLVYVKVMQAVQLMLLLNKVQLTLPKYLKVNVMLTHKLMNII